MNSLQLWPCQQIVGVTALALVSFSSCSEMVQARPAEPASTIHFVPPALPDRMITSGRQRGGATRRGQCKVAQQPLTALVPATRKALGKQKQNPALDSYESVFAKTTSSSPIFWFYNPYVLTSKLPIEFVFEDASGKLIYKSTLTAPGTQPGIISFRLPTKVAPLDVGKKYHWYFSINCDANAPALVHGWIQRVALNPAQKNQVKKATARQRAAVYASNGIWHDALSTLGELRAANPKDQALFKDWTSLLHSVNLDAIVQEPITGKLSRDSASPAH